MAIWEMFPLIVKCCLCVVPSGGGWVLSKAVSTWKGIAVYSPIINGKLERTFEHACTFKI